MIKFRLLRSDGADDIVWESFYRAIPHPRRSVHFSPGYARTQEIGCGGEAWCAIADDGGWPFVMQPFLLRTDDPGRVITESLYGYGGPVSSAEAPELWPAILLALEGGLTEFRMQRGVVCERTVLAPFMVENQRKIYEAMGVPTKHVKDVVVLPTDLASLDAGMSDKRRAGVFKAKRDGITVRRTASLGHSLSRFWELYKGTMDKVGAAPRWRFARQYFEAHLRELRHRAVLVEAIIHGEKNGSCTIVSSALVLVDGAEAQYQFAGNSGVSGASDLLVLEAAAVARDAGCLTLDLGGGVTAAADDSVFWYKSTFSPRRRPVYVVERVYDQQAFDKASDGYPQTGFFPPWRAGAAAVRGMGVKV